MKIKLMSDWKRAWKWMSIWAMILAGAIQATYSALEPEQKKSLGKYSQPITIAILALGVAGRMVRQYPESCDDCPMRSRKDKNQ